MRGSASLVVLDFDGVVCDALVECAAVSAVGGQPSGPLPDLADALETLTAQFVTRFASVRPHCRTLADFMVVNSISGPVSTRAEFEAARAACDRAEVDRQSARAQAARDHWRIAAPSAWLALHTPYPGVEHLLTAASGRVAIVSNKDAASIHRLLEHFGVAQHVREVVGGCSDKPSALARLAGGRGAVSFIDDNLANVLAVGRVPGVRSLWATWGYHSLEDRAVATARGVTALTLDELGDIELSPSELQLERASTQSTPTT